MAGTLTSAWLKAKVHLMIQSNGEHKNENGIPKLLYVNPHYESFLKTN